MFYVSGEDYDLLARWSVVLLIYVLWVQKMKDEDGEKSGERPHAVWAELQKLAYLVVDLYEDGVWSHATSRPPCGRDFSTRRRLYRDDLDEMISNKMSKGCRFDLLLQMFQIQPISSCRYV